MHVHWRARQQRHPAFDGDDETFLTVGWMRGLLRVAGARKTSDRVAAAAIGYLESSGLIVDTGRVKTPRRRPDNGETVEPFQRWGRETMVERAAPSLLGRSYWWRVFRVPALTKAREAVLPKTAYTRTPGRPLTPVGSLSAFLLPSRADSASAAPLAPESGLRSVGVLGLGAAMTCGAWPAKTTFPALVPLRLRQ